MKKAKPAKTAKELYERERNRLVAKLDKSYKEAEALWSDGLKLLKRGLRRRTKKPRDGMYFLLTLRDEAITVSKHSYVDSPINTYVLCFTVPIQVRRFLKLMANGDVKKLEAIVPKGEQIEVWMDSHTAAGGHPLLIKG